MVETSVTPETVAAVSDTLANVNLLMQKLEEAMAINAELMTD